MLGYYNYTVILTYIGMLSGFLGITFAMNGDVHSALICLMVAGFCDMFDGKIASTRKRTRAEKRFGIQIDSLSDLICFGVLPGVIICAYCEGSRVSALIAGFYTLCALIRLAWFNVDEEERQSEETGAREHYLGMPVTTVALLLPTLMAVDKLAGLPTGKIAPAALVVFAVLFLAPVRVKKPARIGKLVMLLLGCAALVLVILAGAEL